MNVLSLFDGMSCGREVPGAPRATAERVLSHGRHGRPLFPHTPPHAHRVREVADNPAVVQVGMLRHAAVQDARQRLDGRGYQAHIVVPARNGKRKQK